MQGKYKQLFIRFPGRRIITLTLKSKPSSRSDLSTLYSMLQEQVPLPPSAYTFAQNGRCLRPTHLLKDLAPLTTLEARLSLHGGKGGFGAQLKQMAKNQKKVTNFDRSRNLAGRRIRDEKAEKKLQEWYTQKL